jgi:hypothetical protein
MRIKSTFVACAVTLTALVASAEAAAPGPSSNGHGGITVTSTTGKEAKRQFTFSAVTRKDGTVTGSAVLRNPEFDFFAHFDISCLRVVGNSATFGGTVTKTNDPFFTEEGDGFDRGFFTVVDNGEPGTQDTISSVFFDNVVPPQACQATGVNDFPQRPIENGNVQVKSGS